MLKNWDFYKQTHIEEATAQAEKWVSYIERRIESPIERIAYMHLVYMENDLFGPLEMIIHPQLKIGPYIVDFFIRHWNSDTNIILECDGHDYHEKTKDQAAHDKKRDRYFTKIGYIVLRYTGSQIVSNPMEIYEDVADIILKRKKDAKN